ncbi:hypothetical protein M3Y99_00963000 [Aphelenchoides fujianensis]|nr:hypothetical protein M3Y99_00963000 [Aphelenchoides fujianensis]
MAPFLNSIFSKRNKNPQKALVNANSRVAFNTQELPLPMKSPYSVVTEPKKHRGPASAPGGGGFRPSNRIGSTYENLAQHQNAHRPHPIARDRKEWTSSTPSFVPDRPPTISTATTKPAGSTPLTTIYLVKENMMLRSQYTQLFSAYEDLKSRYMCLEASRQSSVTPSDPCSVTGAREALCSMSEINGPTALPTRLPPLFDANGNEEDTDQDEVKVFRDREEERVEEARRETHSPLDLRAHLDRRTPRKEDYSSSYSSDDETVRNIIDRQLTHKGETVLYKPPRPNFTSLSRRIYRRFGPNERKALAQFDYLQALSSTDGSGIECEDQQKYST